MVTLMSLAGVLAVVLLAIVQAERDLAERRTALTKARLYWSCGSILDDRVLARVYAGRTIVERHPGWTSGLTWALSYKALTAYIQMRLGRAELVEAFLKTPAHREHGCMKIA